MCLVPLTDPKFTMNSFTTFSRKRQKMTVLLFSRLHAAEHTTTPHPETCWYPRLSKFSTVEMWTFLLSLYLFFYFTLLLLSQLSTCRKKPCVANCRKNLTEAHSEKAVYIFSKPGIIPTYPTWLTWKTAPFGKSLDSEYPTGICCFRDLYQIRNINRKSSVHVNVLIDLTLEHTIVIF